VDVCHMSVNFFAVAIMLDRMHPDCILCTGPYGTAKQDSSIISGVANAG
jgi:hypothetical protein